MQRIKEKITESTEASGVILDEESHKEKISSDDCKTVFENLSKDSFQGIFRYRCSHQKSKEYAMASAYDQMVLACAVQVKPFFNSWCSFYNYLV